MLPACLQLARADAEFCCKAAVQIHFGVQRFVQQPRKPPHRLEVARLRRRQCQHAAVVDKKYVVLTHVESERLQRQLTVADSRHKGVLQDLLAQVGGLLAQVLGKTHGFSSWLLIIVMK